MLWGVKNPGLHRACGNAQHRRNFINGVAFHGREQKNQAQFFWQLRKGIIEMRLDLVRSGEVLRGRRARLVLRLRPKRVALLAAFPGAQTIEREAKRDSNEPRAETAAVAQPIEPAIGAQQGFLGYVFRVSGVAQYAASDAISKRAALGEALLQLAPRVRLARPVRPAIPLVMRAPQQNV